MTDEVVSMEGNGYRPSHKGDGWSMGGVMYTLNSVEVHCVCYRIVHSENEHGDRQIPDKCGDL